MKKIYMTPKMESERFVPNEYCYTCWHVTCAEHGTFIKTDTAPTDGVTQLDKRAFSDDGFDKLLDWGWFYSGIITDEDGKEHAGEYEYDGYHIHPVSVEERTGENAANAS